MRLIGKAILLSLIISSCSFDQCGDAGNPQYDITTMTAKLTISTQPFDNFGLFRFSTLELPLGQSTNIDQFVLELSATTGPAFSSNDPPPKPMFSLSLIPTANACSPIEPFTNEKIASITITSSNDFSNEYPSGTDLAPLFLVISNDLYLFNRSTGEKLPYSLDEYLALNPPAGKLLQLSLSLSPPINKTHQFNIEYSHENGEFFMMSLPEVTFE